MADFGYANTSPSVGPINPATGLPYQVTTTQPGTQPTPYPGFGYGNQINGGGWTAGGGAPLGPTQHYGATLTSPGGAPWQNQMIAYGNMGMPQQGTPGGSSGGPGSYVNTAAPAGYSNPFDIRGTRGSTPVDSTAGAAADPTRGARGTTPTTGGSGAVVTGSGLTPATYPNGNPQPAPTGGYAAGMSNAARINQGIAETGIPGISQQAWTALGSGVNNALMGGYDPYREAATAIAGSYGTPQQIATAYNVPVADVQAMLAQMQKFGFGA